LTRIVSHYDSWSAEIEKSFAPRRLNLAWPIFEFSVNWTKKTAIIDGIGTIFV